MERTFKPHQTPSAPEQPAAIRQKIVRVAGLPVAYYQLGQGYPVLLLHGWGTEAASLRPVQQFLGHSFATYSLDFPGFGQTPPPEQPWSVGDYADFTAAFCRELGLEQPVLLGHSFGGRVSILLGSRSLAAKIILVDSAGILPQRSAKYYVRVYSYKTAKKVFALPLLRRFRQQALAYWQKSNPSSDYQQAQGVMRPTFVKVVNEDLAPYLPRITAPTLLVWGDQDTATPLADAHKMERLIPDAGLAVLEGAGHYSYLDRLPQFLRIIDCFLAEDKKTDKGE